MSVSVECGTRAQLLAILLATALLAGACGRGDGGDGSDVGGGDLGGNGRGTAATIEPTIEPPRTPAVSITAQTTWQWQLQGEINTNHRADLYDIDLFDAPTDVIEELRAAGRNVICYFSAGSFEAWRNDADDFPAGAVGEPLDGWEDERWVDTRDPDVRAVLAARIDLAFTRGCDGVEPDNVTAFQNDSGFDLTAGDQLDFNRFLADAAHDRGLLIGLKNDLSQIPDLVDDFDFAINEECLQYGECDAYTPFIAAGKAVFNAEYTESAVRDPEGTCAAADAAGLRTLILPLDLDDEFRIACD